MDTNNIGQGRQYNEAVDAYDAKAGKYANNLPAIATEAKLPTQQMPMAPAPSPFVLKGAGTGER